MRLAAVFLAASLALLAQEPEFRGIVVEAGTGLPINGADVKLTEFVMVDGAETEKPLVTLVTNERGEYAHKPGHFGSFLVEVSKRGYFRSDFTGPEGVMVEVMDFRVGLARELPPTQRRTELMRPGELSGRIVDENRKPIANVSVDLEPTRVSERTTVTTDADGVFRAPVRPDQYRLHVRPTLGLAPDILPFSEAAFATMDEDVEPLYWPGGLADPRLVTPLTVTGGGLTDTGTIMIRKTRYFRARLSIACPENAILRFRFPFSASARNPTPLQSTHPCQPDLLLRGVQPGTTTLAVTSRGAEPKWALVSIRITDQNVAVPVVLQPMLDIPGRVIGTDGKPLPASDATVTIASANASLPSGRLTYPDKDHFLFHEAAWGTHRIEVQARAPDTYLSEIRYGGQRLTGSAFDPIAGAEFEIVLARPGASISVTTTRDGKPAMATVVVARWPLDPASISRSSTFVDPLGNAGGEFQQGGLAPGEYRVLVAAPGRVLFGEDLLRELDKAQRVTLQAGERRTLQVEVPH